MTKVTKLMNCSECAKFKKGTPHSYLKTDSLGKWYICDHCKKTSTWEMINSKDWKWNNEAI